MHSLVIAGSLVIEFVNQLMIYRNTLHESCSLNKILQFNKEHGVNSSSHYRLSGQLKIVELLSLRLCLNCAGGMCVFCFFMFFFFFFAVSKLEVFKYSIVSHTDQT